MRNLYDNVMTLWERGWSAVEICEELDVDYFTVVEIIESSFADSDEETEPHYDDSMDGDEASALASVGWGTDEDYGSAADTW